MTMRGMHFKKAKHRPYVWLASFGICICLFLPSAFSITRVQSGQVTLEENTTFVEEVLEFRADQTSAFLIYSWDTQELAPSDYAVTGKFATNSKLRFERYGLQGKVNIKYSVVESDILDVQSGQTRFEVGDVAKDVKIGKIDPAKTFVPDPICTFPLIVAPSSTSPSIQ